MSDEKVNFKWSVILKPWPVLLLIVLVLGGIWFGLFTPTEAGGVGAFGALLLALYKKKVTCRALLSTLLETGVTAGSIFIMLMSAQMFSYKRGGKCSCRYFNKIKSCPGCYCVFLHGRNFNHGHSYRLDLNIAVNNAFNDPGSFSLWHGSGMVWGNRHTSYTDRFSNSTLWTRSIHD